MKQIFLIVAVALCCFGCCKTINRYICIWNCEDEKKVSMTKDQYEFVKDKSDILSFGQKLDSPTYLFGGGIFIEYHESSYSFFKSSENEVIVQKLNRDQSSEYSKIFIEEYNEYVNELWLSEFYELSSWD